MTDKDKLKKTIHSCVDGIIDNMDKIQQLDYFEINIKHTNGEILCKPSYTDKNKIQ